MVKEGSQLSDLLRDRRGAEEARGFVIAEHQVHVLNRLARGPLAEVVNRR